MANKKISELAQLNSLTSSNYFAVVRTGETMKVSGSVLLEFISSSLTGNVSGSALKGQIGIWTGREQLSGNINFTWVTGSGLSATGSHRFGGGLTAFTDHVEITGALGVSKNISSINITASIGFTGSISRLNEQTSSLLILSTSFPN